MAKIAVILIRGVLGLEKGVKDTLTMLNLFSKFNCIVLEDNPVNKGMIFKVKDYVTFGLISEEVLKELNEKRPAKKKTHRLHPPRGGLKSSKKNFKDGGALGERKEKINDFIKKML